MFVCKRKKVKPAASFTVPNFLPSEGQVHNMQRLLRLIEDNSVSDCLEIAEIHRELSDFESAEKAWAMSNEEESTLQKLLKQLIDLRMNAPCRYRM